MKVKEYRLLIYTSRVWTILKTITCLYYRRSIQYVVKHSHATCLTNTEIATYPLAVSKCTLSSWEILFATTLRKLN